MDSFRLFNNTCLGQETLENNIYLKQDNQFMILFHKLRIRRQDFDAYLWNQWFWKIDDLCLVPALFVMRWPPGVPFPPDPWLPLDGLMDQLSLHSSPEEEEGSPQSGSNQLSYKLLKLIYKTSPLFC